MILGAPKLQLHELIRQLSKTLILASTMTFVTAQASLAQYQQPVELSRPAKTFPTAMRTSLKLEKESTPFEQPDPNYFPHRVARPVQLQGGISGAYMVIVGSLLSADQRAHHRQKLQSQTEEDAVQPLKLISQKHTR